MRHRSVREIMSCVGICQQPPGASVRDGCRRMAEHRCGSVLVVERGCLLGIFTQRDAIERVFACGRDPDLTLLAEVMTREPDTVAPDATVKETARLIHDTGHNRLPVVDDAGRLVGVVTRLDVLGALAA